MSCILALDSSTDACSAALYLNGRLNSRFEIASKSHTQRLLPMVDELLTEEGLKLSQLDAIAFGRGPGSFTGLRICMGIVQGLAFGSGLPVLPVSTLEAMALTQVRNQPDWAGVIVPALDARMSEVYWAAYRAQGDGELALLEAEAVASPELVVERLAALQLSPSAAIGSGWQYPQLAGVAAAPVHLSLCPRAEEIALLGAKQLAAGKAQAIAEVQPIYLRDSVSWQKRSRIRQQPPRGLE